MGCFNIVFIIFGNSSEEIRPGNRSFHYPAFSNWHKSPGGFRFGRTLKFKAGFSCFQCKSCSLCLVSQNFLRLVAALGVCQNTPVWRRQRQKRPADREMVFSGKIGRKGLVAAIGKVLLPSSRGLLPQHPAFGSGIRYFELRKRTSVFADVAAIARAP